MNERNNFTKYSLFLGFLGWSPSMLYIYIYNLYPGWMGQADDWLLCYIFLGRG